MPVVIEPITPKSSVVDTCADALRTAILQGRLVPGERLPPERVLAEQLGVNRVTLRSALARLAREHLLSARQGSAHVVLDFRHLGGPELVSVLFDAASDDDLVTLTEDILHVRRALARIVFTHIAQATKAALEPVHAAIAAFIDTAKGGDVDAIARADLTIVRALLDATGRPALQLFWNPVLTIVSDTPRLRAAMYADPTTNVRGWSALDTWLAAPRRERGKPEDTIAILEMMLQKRDQLVLDHMKRPS